MQQLLSIETVPISIEYKSKKPVAAVMTRSVSLRLPIRTKTDYFDSAINLSYNATAQYGENSSRQPNIHLLGDPIDNLAFQQLERSIASTMDHLPGAKINNVLRNTQTNFEMSGLPADWGIFPRSNTSFTPGNLELEVTEFPKIIIKYTGKPLYIPKSSDPDYIPPDKLNTSA